ncbi:MAG TPA: tetratricopeptide repeat protein, partial [Myxococcaceae bacterium]|nr:tetratricopeptide repeat protein [Myxococcaceae bacterium]
MSARANQLLEAGLWLKMSGDLEGARRLFEQALKLDPDSIRARELLGQSVPEAEAVPEELRDVPVTRSDLFSVPLPRLFQDEPPASIPEEWWNAPPSDGMGNTSRFFVRPPSASGSADAAGPTHTIPWGPSPLASRERGPSARAAGEEE